jgi:hypothetical protein
MKTLVRAKAISYWIAIFRVRQRLLLLFLSSEFVEARLNRGEVFNCWGHDKPYLALAV